MGRKALLYLLGAAAAILLLAGTFSIGMFVGGVFAANDQSPEVDLARALAEITTPELSTTADPLSEGDLDKLFEPFWQAWDLVHELYVEQPVDDQEMMRGAIQGMMDSLGDQHSSYMDPDEFRQASIPLEGEYEGIGAWVDPDAEYLTIVSPMPDSPAERAGLKPGDQIIAIDGEDMTGIDGNLVIRKVMGPAGTRVTLTILREGVAEPFDVGLIREKIIVPSVVSEMLDGEVAYIQLISFGEDTTAELKDALKDLLARDPVGLVLDLRNNGGGTLDTAIEVASQFIDEA